MRFIICLASIIILSCETVPSECVDLKFYSDIIYPDEGIQEKNITLKDSVKYTGRCSRFYENGKLSSIQQFKDGKDHGQWKFYHPNGNLETIGKFRNGLRHGQWKYFYENGQTYQIAQYKLGAKHGIWKVYEEDGELLVEQKWNNGESIN